MLENFTTKFKKKGKKDQVDKSKDAAKERLHLVLMQDRANVSADFLDMMKQEIVDVIKKYIDVDETELDVKLTNKSNDDGTSGAPALFANIPIVGINEEKKKESLEISKLKRAEEDTKLEEQLEEEKNESKQEVTGELNKEKIDDETDDKDDKKKSKATKSTKTATKKTSTTKKTVSSKTTKATKSKTKDSKSSKKSTEDSTDKTADDKNSNIESEASTKK